MIDLVSGSELAKRVGYSSDHASFRRWCAALGITAAPGRPNHFDLKLVRRRLDEAQGLLDAVNADGGSLVSKRRARLAKW